MGGGMAGDGQPYAESETPTPFGVLTDVAYRVAEVMLDDAPMDFDEIRVSADGVEVPTSTQVFVKVDGRRMRVLRTIPLLLRVESALEWVPHDWQGLGGLALGEIRKDDPMHLRFIDVRDAESGFTVISSAEVVSIEVFAASQAEFDEVVAGLRRAETWVAQNPGFRS